MSVFLKTDIRENPGRGYISPLDKKYTSVYFRGIHEAIWV
jgi:hypothetical protein